MEQDSPANSPAKQFLAALSKASQELETAIAQTYEEALKLNVQLTESARVQIEQTDASLEKELRLSTNVVLEERQNILVELADLRQQEMRVLSDTARTVREHLTGKLEELVGNFDYKLKSAVQSFQEQLTGVEQRLSLKVERQDGELTEKITEFSQAVRQEIVSKKKRLDEFEHRQQQALFSQAEQSAGSIAVLGQTLESTLRSDIQRLVEVMSETVSVEDAGVSTVERITKLQELALTKEKVERWTANDLQHMHEMPARFRSTVEELAQLQTDVHSTAVKNMTVRYKTELMAAAQHSEDQLKLIASEVQLTLRQFEKVYGDRFEQRVAEFEKDAMQEVQDAMSDQERAGLKMNASKDKELKDLFIVLRRTASETLRSTVKDTERTFESLFEEYKGRLENQRRQKGTELEQECRRASEELSLIFKGFDRESNDIERQLMELESATAELDEFVSALSHADLDF